MIAMHPTVSRIEDVSVLAQQERGVLTVVEVASELRCSKAHVLNLINGKVRTTRPLPSLWLGRRRLVRRRSLDEWIKANEHEAML